MPELPEVEVTRRSFAAAIQGAGVLSVTLGKPLRWPLGCTPDSLAGQQVHAVDRRGKYLLVRMNQGMLLVHLGMSGRLRFGTDLPAMGVHDHFSLHTTAGELRLTDPRRFGAVVFAACEQAPVAQRLLGRLGVEPLSEAFDAQVLHAGFARHRAAVKQVLLSGHVVVGVGNIYASEVLHLAGIAPHCPACEVPTHLLPRLSDAIRHTLLRAVEVGGSTLRDFSSASGETGHFQLEAQVYGRSGLPCFSCGTPIQRMVQGQRATYFCPCCQPAPAPLLSPGSRVAA